MKAIIIIPFFLFCVFASSAQRTEKKECSCGFQSILNIGLLEGDGDSDFLIQSVNGYHYKGWFAGIGAGIDYYRFRSIPVFLDIRKNILNKNLTPFVYADAGMHFPWTRNDETYYWDATMSKGLYYDAGIGMNFTIRKNQGITFSAGYSYKFTKETTTWPVYCIAPPCPTVKQTRSYDLNRLSMKLGWRING